MKLPRYEEINWYSQFDPDAPAHKRRAEFLITLLMAAAVFLSLLVIMVAFTPTT